ncbi:MAG TPA: hypothetical protein VK658_09470 [Chryseolinea sp.]|nr:hypothetical protein [Chryseolinea sp.]
MTTRYHLIQELEGGVPNDPVILYNEEKAGRLFEERVSTIQSGFRKKRDDETWAAFEDAFQDYTYSDDVAYDTCDWEIHWYKLSVEDRTLAELVDLYFTIINHATIETLTDDDIQKSLKSVRHVIEEYGIIE